MKRPALADEDDLMRMTRRVLLDFAAETRWRGHAVGKVVYGAGDGEWLFPLDFDDFLELGRDLLCAEGQRRTRTVRSMGSTFAILGMSLAQDVLEQPERLASERKNWEDTLCYILRARGPRAVVIVQHFALWPSGIGSCPIEPPLLIALGFHATRIVGYTCAQRAGEVRGMSFGLPVALSARLAHTLGEKKYLKIFGPGRM